MFYDENGNVINIKKFERAEQELADKYIQSNDIVLELGARYGTVSYRINRNLENKLNQVVVEPDDRVWSALENNKIINGCGFHIVKGFISNNKLNLVNKDTYHGYGATFSNDENSIIPNYKLDEIKNKYNLNFNVLVADCEGFLETFFDENPTFINNLRLLMYEADYKGKCDYKKIENILLNNNFTLVEKILIQHVWIRT